MDQWMDGAWSNARTAQAGIPPRWMPARNWKGRIYLYAQAGFGHYQHSQCARARRGELVAVIASMSMSHVSVI